MSRLLAFTFQAPAHVFPFVPVLHELRIRGHDVRFAMFASPLLTKVADIPVRALRWQPHLPISAGRFGAQRESNQPPNDIDSFDAYGEPLAQALEGVLAEETPDLILIDPMLWGGMIAAEASGLPWVSLAHNPITIRGLGVDPRGPGLRPPRTLAGRIWHQVIEAGLNGAGRTLLPTMNAVRTARGLTPLSCLSDIYHTPPRTIATTAEPFEYPRSDWSPSVRFVGPLVWEDPVPAPAWLSELDERPTILLVSSSVPHHGATGSWESCSLRALAAERFQVIATLPVAPIQQSIPTSVRLARFIPHSLLLPHVSCVVCHGGSGITHKALGHGVPVVAVPEPFDPYAPLDRLEVAKRVEVAHAGVCLPVNQITPERLVRAVHQALACRPGAECIRDAFRRTGGAAAAADAVEELLPPSAFHALPAQSVFRPPKMNGKHTPANMIQP